MSPQNEMSPQNNEQIVIGRAKNALLSFFEQGLSVPKIYLDADWQEEKVDVLAIDRAGVGDVSIALVLETTGASPYSDFLEPYRSDMRQKLLSLQAHFKYLVTITQDSSRGHFCRFSKRKAQHFSSYFCGTFPFQPEYL